MRALAWPDAFDPAGRRALYVFNGDLFLLNLATARFSRLTTTEAEERSPEFSPDGLLYFFSQREWRAVP